jgi:quercetin dioxygenase-like cupin family protein
MTDIGKKQGRSEQRESKPRTAARKAIKTRLAAGKRVMMHTHTEEESGYLISGHIVLTIGGMDYEMHEGDVWKIPGGVPHGSRVIEDSVTVEIIPAVRSEKI